MGNFITDTLGKIASNVTQSVVSALIVTAVTTYLIVSPGKKDETKDGAKADSAKSSTTLAPLERSGAARENSRSTRESTETGNGANAVQRTDMNSGGETKTIALPATEKNSAAATNESRVTDAASKAYKDLPVENPTEKNLESTIDQGRARGDSLVKAHPQEQKPKEVKKEDKKETKDVKKRADEVFDELDQEVQK